MSALKNELNNNSRHVEFQAKYVAMTGIMLADSLAWLREVCRAEAFIVRGGLVPSDIGIVDFESSFGPGETSAPAHLSK